MKNLLVTLISMTTFSYAAFAASDYDAPKVRPLAPKGAAPTSDRQADQEQALYWRAMDLINQNHLEADPRDPRENSFGDESLQKVQIDQSILNQRPEQKNNTDKRDLPKASSMVMTIFKSPWRLGFSHQFGILEIDGKFKNAFVVSTGKPGLETPNFNSRPQIERIRGIDFPWHLSTISGAEMYWGMRIQDSWWIHSTPYYYEFRKPSSLGCVRTTHPTAMEIWDQATNGMLGTGSQRHSRMRVKIVGNDATLSDYNAVKARLGFTDGTIKTMVAADLTDAMTHNSYVYHGNGHWRQTPNRVFSHFYKGYYPSCSGYDCFKVFNMKPRVN